MESALAREGQTQERLFFLGMGRPKGFKSKGLGFSFCGSGVRVRRSFIEFRSEVLGATRPGWVRVSGGFCFCFGRQKHVFFIEKDSPAPLPALLPAASPSFQVLPYFACIPGSWNVGLLPECPTQVLRAKIVSLRLQNHFAENWNVLQVA